VKLRMCVSVCVNDAVNRNCHTGVKGDLIHVKEVSVKLSSVVSDFKAN